MIRHACILALRSAIAVAAMAAAAMAAFAASPQTVSAGQADAAPMRTELVTTGLYLIRGGGGNSLLRLSGNGTVLVDAKSPGNYAPLMSQVRKLSRLSDMPLRAVVLTSGSVDYAGNAAQFEAAGVAVIAQRKTLARLPAGQPEPAVPAFDGERDLRIGGVDIELRHFGPARSDGDAVVYFPDLKVIALGELFTPGTAPAPDDSAGGSLPGWSTALGRILQLDFDRVVPGEGPVMSRADLLDYKARLDALSQPPGRTSADASRGAARGPER